MSTEHQRYSTENQGDVIYEYAARRGFEIVQTYADDGKSGLRIEGRNSLKRLIDDVQTGAVDFRAILVYDVSRWGRFQDTDESAYYEYICKRAGISEERIAPTLDIDVARIRQKRDLLTGICPEAVALQKEKDASPGTIREMRKVKPMRQIEMAELMLASANFTASYAMGITRNILFPLLRSTPFISTTYRFRLCRQPGRLIALCCPDSTRNVAWRILHT